jgi:bifunctional ADP-heptose synthase (sugar kinase/adenylyltransferase)
VATFTAELDRAIKAAYEAQDARRRTLMSKSSAVLTKAAVLQDQMEKLETELEIVMKEAHDTEAKLRVLQDEQLRLRTDTKNRFLEERRKALDLIEEA